MKNQYKGIIQDWMNILKGTGYLSKNKSLFEELCQLYEETRSNSNLLIYELSDLFFENFVEEPWDEDIWLWSNDDFYTEPFTLNECPDGFYEDECTQVCEDINQFWSHVFWDSKFLNEWLNEKLNNAKQFL